MTTRSKRAISITTAVAVIGLGMGLAAWAGQGVWAASELTARVGVLEKRADRNSDEHQTIIDLLRDIRERVARMEGAR